MNTTTFWQSNVLSRCLYLVSAILMLGPVFAKPSLATSDTVAPMATVSLASGTNVTQGEPIILQYRIHNMQNKQMIGLTFKNGQDWLSEKLTDASGNVVPSVQQYFPQQYASDYAVELPEFVVPASETYVGYQVVNPRLALPHPGKYTLSVRMNFAYSFPANAPNESDVDPLASDTPGVITQTYSWSLVITPMDKKRLASMAEALTASVIKSAKPTISKQFLLKEDTWQADALFSLPDSVAASYWQEIASNHINIAARLYQVHTAGAARVLASVISLDPTLKENLPYQVWLDRLYGSSTGSSKQEVRDVFSEYGIDMPGGRIESIGVQ